MAHFSCVSCVYFKCTTSSDHNVLDLPLAFRGHGGEWKPENSYRKRPQSTQVNKRRPPTGLTQGPALARKPCQTQGSFWPQALPGLTREGPECEASLPSSPPHCPEDIVEGAVSRGPCTHCVLGGALEKEDMALLLEAHHVGLGYRNRCGFLAKGIHN